LFGHQSKISSFQKGKAMGTFSNRAFWKVEHKHHDRREKLQKGSSNSILQALKKSYAKVQKSYCFSS
jgi:hypothetical protein